MSDPNRMTPGLVVLSPHLDDAVLSCGGRIAHVVAAGARVRVVTVFTRDEPEEPPSELARDLRRWWKLPAGEVMRRRRAEDEAACHQLGAEPIHLDLPEAPYRLDDDGRARYADLRALFGEVHPGDAALVTLLAEKLAAGEWADDEMIGPLGVGNHVDHQIVRRALERARPGARLYEEFPYTEWKWFAVRRALVRPAFWEGSTLALDEREIDARLAAIEAYASQVPSLFRNAGRLRRQLRRSLRRTGGERLWRRRATES